MISRRDFGKAAFAGVPLLAAGIANAATEIRLGVSTYSFRDFLRTPGRDNVDDIVKALQQTGVREIELASTNTEPAGPNSGPAVPRPPSAYPDPVRTPTPSEVAAAKLAVRNALRSWRLATPPAAHESFRAKFQSAGIGIFAYRVDYDASFTDEEIEVTLQQAKALGVTRIASQTGLTAARRLAPFAAKHALTVALHNSPNRQDPDAIATPESFRQALALSKNFQLNFDIGNFTAVNLEPVAFLQENRATLSHIQIKDRTRNGGRNEQFGDGDTPIADVLRLVRDKKLSVPVFVEYEYIGLGTPLEEVRRCLSFVKSALS